jgi:hypothetical protein
MEASRVAGCDACAGDVTAPKHPGSHVYISSVTADPKSSRKQRNTADAEPMGSRPTSHHTWTRRWVRSSGARITGGSTTDWPASPCHRGRRGGDDRSSVEPSMICTPYAAHPSTVQLITLVAGSTGMTHVTGDVAVTDVADDAAVDAADSYNICAGTRGEGWCDLIWCFQRAPKRIPRCQTVRLSRCEL